MQFVPSGLGLGLAITDGFRLVRLIREDSMFAENEYDYGITSHIVGTVLEQKTHILPGRFGPEIAVLNVGGSLNRKTLLAVAFHEATSVKGRLDFIKVRIMLYMVVFSCLFFTRYLVNWKIFLRLSKFSNSNIGL